MVLLDKLLPKLEERDSRVLTFSQMTKLLDILEDYLMYCGYYYCRIDGNTGGEDRDASIEAFNSPGSEKFVFLLSTRAGGLVINRATADVVILYDSVWNPQIDLQAQDRAHRIGQKKEVQVFRFCTKCTIEEKVIERAYKKLALDALVIQQGRLAEQKTVNKDELLQMVQFGAEMVFISKDSTITDDDIGRIIAKAEGATAELDAKMKKFTEDAIKFKMDDTADSYDFDDEKDENKFDFKKIVSDNWIEPPKRERKRNHSESEYFKQTMRQSGPARPKGMERRGSLIIAIFVCLFAFSSCRELKVTVMHKHNQTDKHDHLATYNHTLATILVQYASAVYLSDLTELFTWTCSRCDGLTEGFEMIELIVDVKRCLQGFVGFAADLNATVIAFRGTQETSIQNWVEDLYWKQLDIDYPGVDGAMVHHGFYTAYHNTSLRPGVLSALQKSKELYGDTKIMVTGHSMGGAMAAFCGLDLRLSLGEQNVQVMTFGQPRIGNVVFASYFNQLVLETIRVTHGHDIVPHLPPYYYYFPKKTYHHFPREVWIYTAALGSFVYTVEKVCDGSGEDPTCSRSVSGNSINDHLTYYGVQMGCDESSSCRIVMDPHLVTYSRRDADGNLILSRDPSVPILKLSTDGDQSSTLV